MIVSLLLALWSASSGTQNLIAGGQRRLRRAGEPRLRQEEGARAGPDVGAILFFAIAASLVAVFPAVASALGLKGAALVGVQVLRWLVLLFVLAIALAILYRVAPNRDDPKFRWTSVGAAVAVVIWILASIGFSLYANYFSSYDKTYGSLAGVVVLLLWLWLSIIAVLLGAEINAEAEKQTVRDTTAGPEKPLGERDAVKADVTPDQPDPDPEQQGAGTRQDAARR